MTTTVTVRYWAGARAAAGVDEEAMDGGTVAEILRAAEAAHPELQPVLPVASILVEGVTRTPDYAVQAGQTVEVLPPFAGG